MDLDCQPAGELREGAVENLEKQHYLALHAKFGGGQQAVAGSGTALPQSKTGSQILGLDRAPDEENSVGIHRPAAQKKREQKTERKGKQWERESVKSEGSKWSANRSTKTGEYPCTAPNCGKMFATA